MDNRRQQHVAVPNGEDIALAAAHAVFNDIAADIVELEGGVEAADGRKGRAYGEGGPEPEGQRLSARRLRQIRALLIHDCGYALGEDLDYLYLQEKTTRRDSIHSSLRRWPKLRKRRDTSSFYR